MSLDRRPKPAHRDTAQRGATAVEAALVMPLMLLALLGMIEFSLLFRDSLGATNAAADGARTASVSGRSLDTDYRTLRQIAKGSSALPDDSITKIIVFRASNFSQAVPDACLALVAPNGIDGVCNVYTPAMLAWPSAEFGCDPTPNPRPDPDRYWCPSDRVVSFSSGLDYVGVYIEVNHEFATGFFGANRQIRQTSVLKIEPEAA